MSGELWLERVKYADEKEVKLWWRERVLPQIQKMIRKELENQDQTPPCI